MRHIQKQTCPDEWMTVRSGEEGQDKLTINNLGNWYIMLAGSEIGNADGYNGLKVDTLYLRLDLGVLFEKRCLSQRWKHRSRAQERCQDYLCRF